MPTNRCILCTRISVALVHKSEVAKAMTRKLIVWLMLSAEGHLLSDIFGGKLPFLLTMAVLNKLT